MTHYSAIRNAGTRVALLLSSYCCALALFAQTPTVQLAATNHNGFNISCFGGKDGMIDATISGGTAPYTFRWSSGATTQNVTGLSAGYYELVVTDAANHSGRKDITLTEPRALKADMVAYKYPNGYNVSCFDCYNGDIDITPSDGVAPYSYLWSDSGTTQDHTGLGSGNFSMVVTDANSCTYSTGAVFLSQPDRTDWTMNGNTGTTPGTHFIGSSDNKDVVFKTNGTERFRLLSDGSVKFGGLSSSTGCHLLYVDANGMLKSAGGVGTDPVCTTLPWYLGGNDNVDGSNNRLGTLVDQDLLIITNAVQRMVVTKEGRVGIGTTPPSGAIGQYRLFVEDGIVTRDVLAKTGAWPDYVFSNHYALMPLQELRSYLELNQHLPEVPAAAGLSGGVELGDMQRRILKTVEEQTLYILQLEERLGEVEQRLKALEATRH